MTDKNKILRIFAENLRMQRAKKKLTQEALAEIVGITPQHFYRIENEKSSPTLSVIVNLAIALNIQIDKLIPLDEIKE